jgi:hypothetical protein
MKNLLIGFVLAAIFTFSPVALKAEDPNHPFWDWLNHPSVQVGDTLLQFSANEQRPTIVDGRTLVPIRAIAEALDFSVAWSAQTQTATLESPEYDVTVQIGNKTMYVNESVVKLDVAAQIINGRTMLPLRALAEATGMDVIWHIDINTIFVLEPFPVIYPWPEHLPEHIPGAITLDPQAPLGRKSEIPMRFRRAFYAIPLEILRFAGDREEQWREVSHMYSEAYESPLMRFVEYFNIPREDFDAVIDDLRERRIRLNHALTDEMYELPNADIIYTFDNDIIRYFYRRE